MKRTNKRFLVVILSFLLTLTLFIAMPVMSMASGFGTDYGDGEEAGSSGGAVVTPGIGTGGGTSSGTQTIYINASTDKIDVKDGDLGYSPVYEMTFTATKADFSAYELSFYMPYFVGVQSISASRYASSVENAVFEYYVSKDGLVNVSYSAAYNIGDTELFTVRFTVNDYTPNIGSIQYAKAEFIDVDYNEKAVELCEATIEIAKTAIMGDVDGNGIVDLNDIEIIQNSIVNPYAYLTQ